MGLTSSIYVTPATIERILQGDVDTVSYNQDDLILAAQTATAEIDLQTNSRFQPYLATKAMGLIAGDVILLKGDLLEVTALRTDDGGQWTYPTLWATGDYRLGPSENATLNPPAPFWKIERRAGARAWPSRTRDSVQIEGKWGHYDVRELVTATLADDVDTMTLTIPVSSLTPFEVGHTVLVDAEQMLVTGTTAADPGDPEADPVVPPTPASLTVLRAMNGTVIATHANGATIEIYRYPVVGYLAELLALRAFRRPQNPYGIQGNPDIGAIRIAINDPDVQRQLNLIKNAMVVV